MFGGWEPSLWPAQVAASRAWYLVAAWGEVDGGPTAGAVRWPSAIAGVLAGLLLTRRMLRSVGPWASLLLGANATVTTCHSRTRDLPGVCRRADVLVAAVGSPRLLGADAIKPGATVIDVGMNRTDDGLAGDVDFEAALEVAGAITPVPGGVGPMTIAMLLVNTLVAASIRSP